MRTIIIVRVFAYITKMTVEKPRMWEVGIAGESRLFMGSYAELVEELRGRECFGYCLKWIK
jgi:hypothetical protein